MQVSWKALEKAGSVGGLGMGGSCGDPVRQQAYQESLEQASLLEGLGVIGVCGEPWIERSP